MLSLKIEIENAEMLADFFACLYDIKKKISKYEIKGDNIENLKRWPDGAIAKYNWKISGTREELNSLKLAKEEIKNVDNNFG